MTRLKFTTTLLLACSLSAAGGFWFGFREALSLGVMADSLPRGMIAVQQLSAIRAGQTQNLATALEFNVDDGLVWGYDLFGHPLLPLFGPLWGFEVHPEYEKYAVRLADYRKGNPSPMNKEFLQHLPKATAEDSEAHDQVAESARLHAFKLRTMVERYASNSANAATRAVNARANMPVGFSAVTPNSDVKPRVIS